jgi:hypothetical protein
MSRVCWKRELGGTAEELDLAVRQRVYAPEAHQIGVARWNALKGVFIKVDDGPPAAALLEFMKQCPDLEPEEARLEYNRTRAAFGAGSGSNASGKTIQWSFATARVFYDDEFGAPTLAQFYSGEERTSAVTGRTVSVQYVKKNQLTWRSCYGDPEHRASDIAATKRYQAANPPSALFKELLADDDFQEEVLDATEDQSEARADAVVRWCATWLGAAQRGVVRRECGATHAARAARRVVRLCAI